jgi:hypothetical protein
MCDWGLAIAGTGLALSAAGAGQQYVASQDAASAAKNAQQQQLTAQNQAFMARNQAQQEQTRAQSQITNQQQENYKAIRDQTAANQTQALTDRGNEITRQNVLETNLRDQSQAQVENTTQNVVPQVMANAQEQDAAARNAALAPMAATIQASNPVPEGANSATKSAMAKSMSEAADYTKQYGANLAQLSSYAAPLAQTALATGALNTNLLPLAAQDRLLQAGSGALLLPSTMAYRQSTDYGNSALGVNAAGTADAMALSGARTKSAMDLADLQQSDKNALIQSGLNYAQARAAANQALGSGISSLGNAAIFFGASKGANLNPFGGGGDGKVDITPTKT